MIRRYYSGIIYGTQRAAKQKLIRQRSLDRPSNISIKQWNKTIEDDLAQLAQEKINYTWQKIRDKETLFGVAS